jgi:hypothetical protein
VVFTLTYMNDTYFYLKCLCINLMLSIKQQLLTQSMQDSPFCKANRFAATQEFLCIFRTRKSITTFTGARQLSVTWASSIQSMSPHTKSWRSNLTLSCNLQVCFPIGLLPSGFSTKILYKPFLPHTCYMPHISHSSLFYYPNNTVWAQQIIKLLIMQ